MRCPIAPICLLLALGFARAADLPEALANDNRRPAGRSEAGLLSLRLEIRDAVWNPEGEGGPRLPIRAFAEEGAEPCNPGPLIRTVLGARLHISIHNRLSVAVTVHGLHAHSSPADPPLPIPALETREVDFHASAPGIYLYWASTGAAPLDHRDALDSQLSGALVIDPPGPPATPDRIFVLGHWDVPGDPKASPPVPERETHVINGKSWPHTERLSYTAGETVRWRWVNGTDETHPLHLHGHYFRVEAQGTAARWRPLPPARRRLAATQTVASGSTMDLSWIPERPGNWLFHCHVLFHVAPELRLTPDPAGSHTHDEHDPTRHMAGLVLGIFVDRPATVAAAPPARPHRLRLVVGKREGVDLHGLPGLGYQLAEADARPGEKLGAFTAPGPPIVLTRGEPVEIAVENHLDQSTSVHWHGIELESYYDGVPGWGGDGRQVTPPIRPGETFVARFTPPRSGAFIYHTHLNDYAQLSTGLYGALVVIDPGTRFDPAVDKLFVLSRGGPDDEKDPFLINGSDSPAPLQLAPRQRYRFRFFGITPAPNLQVALLKGGRAVIWKAVAKDGAALSAHPNVQARIDIFPGETYEFEFQAPAGGAFELVAFQPFFKLRTVAPIVVARR
jgi:FtsP/CotA-like multicopper oxidase with cupredoxin domain